ncbi:DUF3630 family protein [Aliiglaciecola sp. LCG003]|uniref:DUF3630 family protein n=1 Tax=Aliiglaciecola sp. LCG003 TaxID=3053655 RepID=UPI0025738C57|nr:DUF3630 family protein [Aliiglaciecola sp. LCG003]WJG09633.1 DUF3630 family protein [Aliiglaciecola sp. LCG003]
MQQLNSARWQLEGENLVSSIAPFPAQEVTIEWALLLIKSTNCIIQEVSHGADRAQIQFIYEEGSFMLCYDATCEAIWIESLSNVSKTSLLNLLVDLQSHNI